MHPRSVAVTTVDFAGRLSALARVPALPSGAPRLPGDGQEGLGFDRVALPAGEVPGVALTGHTVGLNLGGARRVEYSTGGGYRAVEIPRGGASFFPAGAQVAARWSEDSEVALITLDPEWVRGAFGAATDPLDGREALVLRDSSLERHVRALLEEAGSLKPASDMAAAALGGLVAVDLIRYFSAPARELAGGPERLAPWQVRRVEERVRSGLGGPLPLQVLAQEAGLSMYHFARAFRETVGISPAQYVRKERIREAERLLATSLPLQDIARRLHFASPSHFAHAFRSVTGLTPREFRRRSEDNRKFPIEPAKS